MAAHLDCAVLLLADIVGVVDRPGREPEQALFDGFEMIEIGGHDGPLQLQQSLHLGVWHEVARQVHPASRVVSRRACDAN